MCNFYFFWSILSNTLQILGYLRRANTVYKSTDDEQDTSQYIAGKTGSGNVAISDGLHLHFLKARNAWFEKALEDAKNNECKSLLNTHIVHGWMFLNGWQMF